MEREDRGTPRGKRNQNGPASVVCPLGIGLGTTIIYHLHQRPYLQHSDISKFVDHTEACMQSEA